MDKDTYYLEKNGIATRIHLAKNGGGEFPSFEETKGEAVTYLANRIRAYQSLLHRVENARSYRDYEREQRQIEATVSERSLRLALGRWDSRRRAV